MVTVLAACQDTTFQSSVPAYPVRLVIDTRIGPFVHFQPTAFNTYITVNRDGFFLNGEFILPTGATDMWGYGGVVAYVSMNGYVAFDLACPHCAGKGRKSSCTIDGIFAVCPECGERYDVGGGYGVPSQGLSREALRQLNILASDGKLTITQRQ